MSHADDQGSILTKDRFGQVQQKGRSSKLVQHWRSSPELPKWRKTASSYAAEKTASIGPWPKRIVKKIGASITSILRSPNLVIPSFKEISKLQLLMMPWVLSQKLFVSATCIKKDGWCGPIAKLSDLHKSTFLVEALLVRRQFCFAVNEKFTTEVRNIFNNASKRYKICGSSFSRDWRIHGGVRETVWMSNC